MNFTDQTGRFISVPSTPKRIVSLVPSQTELLHYLGLEDEVAGITKFCVHPDGWHQHKQRIGGTKNINLAAIKKLNPDLIIAGKEENVQSQIEELALHFPVWVSDVATLEDACSMIVSVGQLVGKKEAAMQLLTQIGGGFQSKRQLQKAPLADCCYLIWKDPFMTVGGDTFISDMMAHAGLQSRYSHLRRYPVVTIEQLHEDGCRYLLLSSEPYPFKQEHIAELNERLPHTKIVVVDGELFSWYGSRLLHSPTYFAALYQQLTAL